MKEQWAEDRSGVAVDPYEEFDGRKPIRAASLSAERKTARITGMWYAALAITGMIGFLVVRPQISVAGDPLATATNLVERAALARVGVLVELAIVVSQAVVAVWFYKLFRSINDTAAWALAAFGIVNAVAILVSAVFMATAIGVAGDPDLAPGGDTATSVQLMLQLSENSWGVGALFFGLWLIPMGYITTGSGRMPAWLGRILVVGGCGYLASAFVAFGFSEPPAWLVDGLTIPATIGELWTIGYLIIVGIRPVDGTVSPEVAPGLTSEESPLRSVGLSPREAK